MNPIVSRSIVTTMFVTLLASAVGLAAALPARADVTKQAYRAPVAGAAPVVEYDGAATTDNERPSDALPGFGEPSAYEAFEPARIVREAPPRHESLLARARRAASRILAVVKNLPHF